MQLDLDFDARRTPHNGTPTSRAAAESLTPHVGRLEAVVLDAIRDAGHHGRTCDEVEQLAELSHQTTSARVRGLLDAGLIECSGLTRPTRSGRQARVYVAIEERR